MAETTENNSAELAERLRSMKPWPNAYSDDYLAGFYAARYDAADIVDAALDVARPALDRWEQELAAADAADQSPFMLLRRDEVRDAIPALRAQPADASAPSRPAGVGLEASFARMKEALDSFFGDMDDAEEREERPDLWDQVVEVPVADVRTVLTALLQSSQDGASQPGPFRLDGPASVSGEMGEADTFHPAIDALAQQEGLKNGDDVIDHIRVAQSFLERMQEVVTQDGPFKGWMPADDPAELVGDLFDALVEANQPGATAGGEALRMAQAESLIYCLVQNDPDDIVADGGVTCFMVWRQDALRWLNICPGCEGLGEFHVPTPGHPHPNDPDNCAVRKCDACKGTGRARLPEAAHAPD